MEIKDFKDDLWNAVWGHAKKLFWPSLFLTILAGIVFLLVLVPSVYLLFPQAFLFQIGMTFGGMNPANQQEMILEVVELLKGMLWTIAAFYVIILATVVVLGSWTSRVSYAISKRQIEGDNNWMGVIGHSFDHKLIKSLQATIFIMLAYLVMVIVVWGIMGMLISSGFSIALAVLLYLGLIFMVLVFLSRYLLVLPGVVIGNMGLRESIRFSMQNMTMGRSFRLVGTLFIAMIAVMIVIIIISLVLNLILGQGTLNSVVTLLLMTIINTLFFAIAIAGSAGLFYRYGNFEGADEAASPEDHLVTGD